ncbi:replication-relaxation family protein [Paenibacillus sp. 1A_MP2]|uniref:replication-relaxation family protein n=1 Tax=Paenibacillus sp. 1A_MP2 TaxID=3457495 RepID=UPI003FCE7504
MIRPDGQIIIDDKSFFIEFDNNTEGARQLENKFARYIELYETLGFDFPILWVANTEKRINYIHRNWRASIENFYVHKQNLPKCHFAVAGKEFEKIIQRKVPLSF